MQVDRRTTIKWVVAAGAALQLPTVTIEALAAAAAPASGYGKDPNLLKLYEPGMLWPLTFTREQRQLAASLCDLIIPADDVSPAASSVGVVDFVDEWVSAPYPECQRDRATILAGFTWLDREAQKRFKNDFLELTSEQHAEICDDISGAQPKPTFENPTAFFRRYRELTAAGFYTTPTGWKDLEYIGNEPLTKFDGPPAEVLKRLGLA